MINARTLNVLAGHVAIALENARLYTVERRRATQLAITGAGEDPLPEDQPEAGGDEPAELEETA